MPDPINTIDITAVQTPNDENVDVVTDSLFVEMKDSDVAHSVESQITRAKGYWNKLKISTRQIKNY